MVEFSNDIEICGDCDQNSNSFSKPERFKITKGKELVGGSSNESKVYFKVDNLELFKVTFGDIKPLVSKQTTFESNLIDEAQKKSFISFITNGIKERIKINRVYSGVNDGFTPQKFHNKTDDISKRVFVIKNEFGTVFGGYISQSLSSTVGVWIDDPNAFIFQWKPQTKLFKTKESNGYHSFYKNKNKLIEFSNDIEICGDCDQNSGSFSKPERFKITKAKELVGGSSNEDKVYFKVTDFEAFQVNFEDDLDDEKLNDDDLKYESDILTSDQLTPFSDFISSKLNDNVKLKRAYIATNDGFDASTFHNKTDSIGQRVILIKNEFDTIFGGYISIAINDTNEDWINDRTAFLFQYNPEIKIFDIKDDEHKSAMKTDKSVLIQFADDIEISDNCNNNSSSFSSPKSYNFPKGKELVGGSSNDDKVYFKVKEIEVFKIETDFMKRINKNIDTTFNTAIIESHMKQEFITMVAKQLKKPVFLDRVYSGLIDGFNPSTFHDRTDDIAERIVVVKNDFGTVFGGYISVALSSVSDSWIDDPTAFLYQFHPQKKVFPTKEANGYHSFYKNRDKLIEFSNDIEIRGDCDQNSDNFAKPERYLLFTCTLLSIYIFIMFINNIDLHSPKVPI